MLLRQLFTEQLLIVQTDVEISYAANFLAGRWTMYFNKCEVDEKWSTVAKAVLADELGYAAKVCPSSGVE